MRHRRRRLPVPVPALAVLIAATLSACRSGAPPPTPPPAAAGELERLSAEVAAEATSGEALAEPPPPAVTLTLARGTAVFYRSKAFGPRLRAASSGPPSPWTIPGATFNGALLVDKPGVQKALCSWAGAPCPGTNREIAAQHGLSTWIWDCASRQWVVGGSDCGQGSIQAAFKAAFDRDPDWYHEDGWASLASCGLIIPGCQGGPGCPGPKRAAPPVPDPCAALQPSPPPPPEPEPSASP